MFGLIVFVIAQQTWNKLRTFERIKAVAAIKCFVDGVYCLFDVVRATTPLVASGDYLDLPLRHFSVLDVALPNPGRSSPTHPNTSHPLATK